MIVPKPRGALSDALFSALRGHREFDRSLAIRAESHDDLHIALWALNELHYRGFEDVDDELEWHPGAIRVRTGLERTFEAELRARFVPPAVDDDVAAALFRYVAEFDGASISAYVQQEATREEVLELLRWKSIYHLKETDPAACSVPRLPVQAQAALVELMYDEYGTGDPNRHHARLFAAGLEASGLSSTYGDYIDEAPVEVLEDNNAMSLFALNRRLRGAAMGHLAAFEATSSQPSRRMAHGLTRLGLPDAMRDYYLEHVEADAVHEQLVVRAVCAPLIADEPHLREDVFFGAFTCLDLSDRFARSVLARWQEAA